MSEAELARDNLPKVPPGPALSPPSPSLRGSIEIRWSAIAIVASLLSLASVGTLVIIGTIQHVDVLSTVALSLAILSFIIQIGLFVADTWQRGQSELRAGIVNSETKSLLSEMKESARATNNLVNRQFDTVLKHLIETTERTVGSYKGQDREQLRRRLDAELRAVVSGSAGALQRQPAISPEDTKTLSEYASKLTDDQKTEADKLTSSLSPGAMIQLAKFGEDELRALHGNSPPGFFGSLTRHLDELTAAGLVTEGTPPVDFASSYPDEQYYVLTESGRLAARRAVE